MKEGIKIINKEKTPNDNHVGSTVVTGPDGSGYWVSTVRNDWGKGGFETLVFPQPKVESIEIFGPKELVKFNTPPGEILTIRRALRNHQGAVEAATRALLTFGQ